MAADPTLTPKPDLLDSPDFVDDTAPDTLGTPEGDNQYDPSQPLPGAGKTPPVTSPRGNEPHTKMPLRDAEE